LSKSEREIDHIDPRWAEGRDYQLVCGLDCFENLKEIDTSENARKTNRFLPWRMSREELGSTPLEKGDLCQFLNPDTDEWVLEEFRGEWWYEKTKSSCGSSQGWKKPRDREPQREVGRKNMDPLNPKSVNNPNHPKFGEGGKIGGKRACDPSNPKSVNNPSHPSYERRNKENGERALRNQGKKVLMTHIATGESQEFPSIRSAARQLGLGQGGLTNLLNPVNGLKTYKGYTGIKLND
jgi:hypothetical protein